MRKNFPLHLSGKADARVLEEIKRDVRRYVVRERKKPLPGESDHWTFACRVGADEAGAAARELKVVSGAIDAVAATGATAVFVEIVARAATRAPDAE